VNTETRAVWDYIVQHGNWSEILAAGDVAEKLNNGQIHHWECLEALKEMAAIISGRYLEHKE
jgi:hypothetical protein